MRGEEGREKTSLVRAWVCSPFVSDVSQAGRETEDTFLVTEGKKDDLGAMCG